MSSTLKIRNITQSPQTVNALSGRVVINPGQTLDDEAIQFDEGEVNSITSNVKVFQVGDAITDDKASAINAGAALERDALTKSLANSQGEVGKLNADLSAAVAERDNLRNGVIELRSLLGLSDGESLIDAVTNLKSGHDEVDRLKANAATADKFNAEVRTALGLKEGDGIIEGITTLKEIANAPRKLSLIEAVANLDDKNDDHWTKQGQPSMAAIEAMTGGNPTRADVDALAFQRARKTE